MKYKLYDDENILRMGDVVEQFLEHRGIHNTEEYLNVTNKNLHSYELFGNIDVAVNMFAKHLDNKSKFVVVVDSDVDGYCSASMVVDYMKEFDVEVISFIHDGKQHGLTKEVVQFIKEQNAQIVIVPDAGSNDVKSSKELSEFDVDVLILDHHEIERKNDYAVVVSPFNSEYPNKYLSGSGVTWKFLQAFDDTIWAEKSNKYLDLVALSIISDSMSLMELENKYLVSKGIERIDIYGKVNKLLQALLDKASYSMNGVVDIIGIQFYVVPMINAMVRVGSQEDKELMFDAFCEKDQWFPYKKRGVKEEIQEDIYSRVARLCTNAKAKQNREIDKGLEVLIPRIEKNEWNKDKVMFVNAGDDIDINYTGLVAMKLASKYGRPCLLLRKKSERSTEYSGSARNIDCDLEDLKGFLADTHLFNWAQGHSSAFGVSISKNKIKPAIERINKQLENFDFSKTHLVDWVLEAEELFPDIIFEMNDAKKHYGHGIPEIQLVVKGITLDNLEVLGKKADTLKFEINGVSFLKFRCEEEEVLLFTNELVNGKINVLGKPSVNEFNGMLNSQIFIEEYEVCNETK